MSVINSFWFGSAPAPFYQYATANGSNVDISDAGGLQSSGSFTVPSAWNGRKVRAFAGRYSEVGVSSAIVSRLGGSDYDGQGELVMTPITGSPESGTINAAPVVVSTGQVFTFTGSFGTADDNWKGFEVLANGVKGALVNRITTGYSVGTSMGDVEWNNEVYDTDGFHDNSTNPQRLTVDAGTSGLVRVGLNYQKTDTSNEFRAKYLLNGSNPGYGNPEMDTAGQHINLTSPPTVVSSGDYFVARAQAGAASNIDVNGSSWFYIEELPSGLKYAIAKVTSNKSIPSGSTWTNFAGDVESIDVGGWYTAGNGFFTVPSGVTKVRMGIFARASNSLGSAWTVGFKKGASLLDFPGCPTYGTSNASNEFSHCFSGIVECSPGDTFYFCAKTGAGSMAVSADSFVWIEEVPDVTS